MEFEKICEIIGKQLDIDPKTITMESHLVEDLHADSLDVVELVMDLEQEFDTEIPDDVLAAFQADYDIKRANVANPELIDMLDSFFSEAIGR